MAFRNWVDGVVTTATTTPCNKPQSSTIPGKVLIGCVHLVNEVALDQVVRGFDVAPWRADCVAAGVYAGFLVKVVGSNSRMQMSAQPVGPFLTCKCYKLMGTKINMQIFWGVGSL